MKKTALTIILVLLGLMLFLVTSLLVYREWSPEDDSAATIYYLSPNGSDSNPGTNESPWKTITKANQSISPGDTVILKDGVYDGYVTINKSNTLWKAENKHKAIIDGGFAPGMLNNNWSNIVNVWNTRCAGKGKYSPLLPIRDVNNLTIDGLFVRNSCGRGIGISTTAYDKTMNNNKVINTRIDWSYSAGIFAEPYFNKSNADQKDIFQSRMNNFQFIDNEITRTSIGDEYNTRVPGTCPNGRTYCVDISAGFGGINTIVRGNVFAWGEGELAPQPASKGFLFEDNIVVGNKNSFYAGMIQDAVARNNLFFSPENKKPKAGSDEEDATGYWRLGLRNEKGHQDSATIMNTNIAIYNNLIINTGFYIDSRNIQHIGNNSKVYFGHNTLVAGKTLETLLNVSHGSSTIGDGILTGIMENNIFDRRKNPSAKIAISLSNNDQFLLRNNLLPTNIEDTVKGPGDIYENNPGLVNSIIELDLVYPDIGPENFDIGALRAALDINNYRLSQDSPAINAGSSGDGSNQTEIPELVRSQDYLKNSRVGVPDIGAIEYGGVYHTSTPTPDHSPTPSLTPSPTQPGGSTPTPSMTPTPTNTQVPGASPTPTLSGNICGKSDTNGDGVFTIADFAEFAIKYGQGKNTCADKDVDYGPCGGRDANRDGVLNIADFGAAGIGFAQRYYPKLSCAI